MENINLIRKLAWSFHYSTGVDWNDLFQEASLAYYNALETYNPERGKITTHAWYCITNHLKNYLKEQEDYKCKKYEGELSSLEDTILTQHPAETASDFWESLTEDAKQIAEIVLSSSKKFVVLPPEDIDKKIENLAKRQLRDWPKHRVQNGINELRLACQ
jgi:RNA polymerase sigma factor (sigma-70 family)